MTIDYRPPTEETQCKMENAEPKDCHYLMEKHHYARQRPRNEKRVRLLLFLLKRGRLNGKSASLVLAYLPDGTFVVVNGYHTMMAVIAYGMPFRVNVIKIQVADEDELNDLYIHYDRAAIRGIKDTLRGANVEFDFTAAESTVFAAAIRLMLIGFTDLKNRGRSKATPKRVIAGDDDIVVAGMKDWGEYVTKIFQLIRQVEFKDRKIFTSAGIIAVAMFCYRYVPRKAAAFWETVITPKGNVNMSHPAMLLHTKLNAVCIPTSKHRKIEKLRPPVYARLAATAWNMAMKNKSDWTATVLAMPRVRELRKPLVLANTPLDGASYVPEVTGFDILEEISVAADVNAAEKDATVNDV